MRSVMAGLLSAAMLSLPAHAAPNMKEGLWEITTKMEMPGMPVAVPPQVIQQCVTRKDIEDPLRTTPGHDPKDDRCKVTNYKVQGNTATWNVACKGEGAMSGTGSVTYSGERYSGTSKMTMKRGGAAQTMTMHYSGRRVGNCPK